MRAWRSAVFARLRTCGSLRPPRSAGVANQLSAGASVKGEVMRIASAILCMCGPVFFLSGCCSFDYGPTSHRATASIRQNKPAPARAAWPEPTASEAEKARAEQEKQCQQRHIDWTKGLLFETGEEKRMRDEICAAYYRGS
jgi:hypothetical protein